MDNLIYMLVTHFPPVEMIYCWSAPAIVWAYLCLTSTGILRKNLSLHTGYTRKIFHFLIFTSIAVVDRMAGLSGVFLFGACTSVVVFYAVIRGKNHLLYEAIARPTDSPRRTYYIIAPYLATLIGGLATNLITPEYAGVGYLAAGVGDAIAEPVGTRYGKHRYQAPSFTGIRVTRSLEGSAAVFLATLLMSAIWIGSLPNEISFIILSASSLLIASAATIIEALSPHGWDNATMQIVPAWVAFLLLG